MKKTKTSFNHKADMALSACSVIVSTIIPQMIAEGHLGCYSIKDYSIQEVLELIGARSLEERGFDVDSRVEWYVGLTDLLITYMNVKGKTGRASCHVAINRYIDRVNAVGEFV